MSNKVRSNYPPIKLTILLIFLLVIITFTLAFAVYYFPLITIFSCILSFFVFKLFITPQKLTFIEEEYSPDYFINKK